MKVPDGRGGKRLDRFQFGVRAVRGKKYPVAAGGNEQDRFYPAVRHHHDVQLAFQPEPVELFALKQRLTQQFVYADRIQLRDQIDLLLGIFFLEQGAGLIEDDAGGRFRVLLDFLFRDAETDDGDNQGRQHDDDAVRQEILGEESYV